MKANEILQNVFPRRGPRVMVLCDGPRPSTTLLEACLAESDLFLCTDGAGWPHTDLPRPPDVVIGDFDTLDPPPLRPDGPVYLHRPEQNTTDSEKALLEVCERSCSEVLLLGAFGELPDHSLANVALCERFADRLRIALVDDPGVSLRVAGGESVSWALPDRTIVSLMPLGGPARVGSLEGVRWPLVDRDMAWGGPSTISNRVVDPPLRLEVASGSVLVTVRAGGTA